MSCLKDGMFLLKYWLARQQQLTGAASVTPCLVDLFHWSHLAIRRLWCVSKSWFQCAWYFGVLLLSISYNRFTRSARQFVSTPVPCCSFRVILWMWPRSLILAGRDPHIFWIETRHGEGYHLKETWGDMHRSALPWSSSRCSNSWPGNLPGSLRLSFNIKCL